MNPIKSVAKKAYLNMLFAKPHDSIYMFHHVSTKPAVKLSSCLIDTDMFKAFVTEHRSYISLEELCERSSPGRNRAITFDDGLVDVFEIAYPFLKNSGIPFTIFVLTGKLDQPGYISKKQLRIMAADPLVTVGSHGIEHIRFSQASLHQQSREISESKIAIENIIDKPCELIAYPFGDYNETTIELVKEAGYSHGFAVHGRPVMKWNHERSFCIPRLSLEDSTIEYYKRA